jgi:hypothetical protein
MATQRPIRISRQLRLRCNLECCIFLAVKLVCHSDSSGARSPPCTVRTYDAPKVRFSATVGEKPVVELACVMVPMRTENRLRFSVRLDDDARTVRFQRLAVS